MKLYTILFILLNFCLSKELIDKDSLGKSTWNLLHSIGTKNFQSYIEKESIIDMISSLSIIYPCDKCVNHFQAYLLNNPPRLENESSFAIWLCQFHNAVNTRLNKPIYNCLEQEDYQCDKCKK